MGHLLTCRIGLDEAATFDGVDSLDDPDALVTFASDGGAPFMVMVLQAGDWVRMGRPGSVEVSLGS